MQTKFFHLYISGYGWNIPSVIAYSDMHELRISKRVIEVINFDNDFYKYLVCDDLLTYHNVIILLNAPFWKEAFSSEL